MVMRIESSLRLENDSKPEGDGWWTWSVWVNGSPEDVASVESVTYRLHPTFPKPVVHVRNRAENFRIKGSGWGEFTIAADVRTRDGRTVRLERWLELRGIAKEAGTAEKRRPSVFVSHSVTDSPVVLNLRNALEGQGIDVWTADADMGAESGGDFTQQVEKRLQQADAVVALVSDPPSSFVEHEALAALDKGRYVLPVVLKGGKVHGKLSDIARFELPDASHVDSLADHIAARVKDRLDL